MIIIAKNPNWEYTGKSSQVNKSVAELTILRKNTVFLDICVQVIRHVKFNFSILSFGFREYRAIKVPWRLLEFGAWLRIARWVEILLCRELIFNNF